MFCWKLQAVLLFFVTVEGEHLSFIPADDYSYLMNLLLHGYSKKIRPVFDQSKSVDMAVSLWISSINDVIVVEQKMVVSAYVQVTWRDERLSWNATQWGIHTMQFIQVLQLDKKTTFVSCECIW